MAAASSAVDAWSRVLDRYPIDWRRVTTTCRSNETEQRCYGEPTAHGLEELRTRWPRECRLDDENASFIDVGSGFGRLALYIRLLQNVRSVRGVEINNCRHAAATELIDYANASTVGLVNGDIRSVGLGDATNAFCSSQCWTEKLISDTLSLAVFSPSLRCLVLFEDFGFRPRGKIKWTKSVRSQADGWGHVVDVVPIETTWTGVAAIFLKRGRCGRDDLTWAMKNGLNRCRTMAEGLQAAVTHSTAHNHKLRADGEAEHRKHLKLLKAKLPSCAAKCAALRCRDKSGALPTGLPTPTSGFAGNLLARWRVQTCQRCKCASRGVLAMLARRKRQANEEVEKNTVWA